MSANVVAAVKEPAASLQLFDLDELCSLLKISKSKAYIEMRAGRLPRVRIGTRLLFSQADIAAYIESCRED